MSRQKWTTPVGTRYTLYQDILKFPIDIVSDY